jgi:methionine aminotransferase
MAREYGAINLSQGFPDFNCSHRLIERVNHHMEKGKNQYAPMPGILKLREALADKVEELYGAQFNPDTEITITAGATQALYTAITAFVHPGDEVIVFEPAYDAYGPVIEYNAGKPVYINMRHPDYRINWDEVQDAISDKTRMIIINSPHNPTGAVLSPEDIKHLIQIVQDTGIFIVSDEVYEHIIFDDIRHESVARYPELIDRSLIISSFGKTYHTTGWKIGYCLAPQHIMTEFRKLHQFITFAVNTPVQWAFADFIKDNSHYEQLREFYQHKRDLLKNLITGSRFRILPCKGTYFQMVDYEQISQVPDMAFAQQLIREHKIATVPISPFYESARNARHVLRLCFAKKDDTLKKAAEVLCRI